MIYEIEELRHASFGPFAPYLRVIYGDCAVVLFVGLN